MGYFYALAAAVLWGAVYAIDQKLLYNISPVLLFFMSSVITTAALAPVVLLQSENFKAIAAIDRPTLLLVFVSMALGILATISILYAVKHLGASGASIIEIAYPFFVILFSVLFFRTVPTLAFYLGGVLIFAGVAIVIYFQNI